MDRAWGGSKADRINHELPSVTWVERAADPGLPAWLSGIRKVTVRLPAREVRGQWGDGSPMPQQAGLGAGPPGAPSQPPRRGQAGLGPALTQRGSVRY